MYSIDKRNLHNPPCLLSNFEWFIPGMAGYDVCEGRPLLTAWFRHVKEAFQPHYDEAHGIVYHVRDKFGGNVPEAKL